MVLVNEAEKEVKQALARAAKKAFGKTLREKEIVLLKPDAKFGNRAFAAFKLARELKKKPAEAAEELAAEAGGGELFLKPSAAGGYVNFVFRQQFFERALQEILEEKKAFGSTHAGKEKTVVIDYSSPNIGKPMHVGHIRSTILGDSIKRLYENAGFRTVSSNYLCEAGAQTAKLMLALKHFGSQEIEGEKQLLDCYVKIHRELEEKPELEKQAREILEKMEAGERVLADELQRVREISVNAFKKNYELLGISFDETLFDSDLVPEAKKIVEEALAKRIVFKDEEGEIVADLEKCGLPNLVVLRSNGTTLYSTRDLALADYRFGKHKFAKCVYVTASEQNLYFKQMFKLLELLKRPYASNLKHVGFGLIFLEGGKISTREGRVLLLEDVLSEVVAAAKEEVLKRRSEEYSRAQVDEIARQVGVGAAKFAILRVSPEKNIVFKPSDSVKFEGDTGAYVQYTLVRAKSILRKAGEKKGKGKGKAVAGSKAKASREFNDFEKGVIIQAAEFPLAAENAARALQPHQLCDFLLKFCAAFNEFYVNCPVLEAETSEVREQRLQVIKASVIVLENALRLLGISAPEKM